MIQRRILAVLTLSLLLFLGLVACAAPGTEPAAPVTQPPAETPAASLSPVTTLPPIETQATEGPLPAGAEGALAATTADLAARLGIGPQEIETIGVEAEEWSDASLGCPLPNAQYAQVITPGFRITLLSGSKSYDYHTNTGTQVVLCGPDGTPILPEFPVTPGEIDDGKPWMPVD